MHMRFAVLAAACFALAGCADPHGDKQEVSGTVTLKGAPIPDGASVIFEPLDSQDTAATAMLTGGNYQIPRVNGLKPGKYRVRFTCGDGVTAINPVDPSGPGPSGGRGKGNANIISKELVPKEYGTESKQEATVTTGQPNKFDFAIP